MRLILQIAFLCLILLPITAKSQKLMVKPVNNFNLEQYLGVWYEIARIENSFEEGLTNVTATYKLRDNGKISVINKGYEAEDNEWDNTESYGDFAESPDIGHIEVTFFWPFYVDYIVFEIGKNYEYAFVTSDSTEYLWLLSRTPTIDKKIIDHFLAVAKKKQFKIDDLVFVPQEKSIAQYEKSQMSKHK